MDANEQLKANVQEKINIILKEGVKLKCEDNKDEYIENIIELPKWFDEKKFKRGQKFYHDHIWGMFLCNFCGLILIMAVKSILNILMHTKNSSTSMAAYKRYIQTIFHVYIWYDKDFTPGSKLWRSMSEVRFKHNSASRRGCRAGLGGISQKDMALTQFGFMGFLMTKPQMVGIYDASHEDYEGMIHVWRTVGYLLGIEDRFNICTGNVEETRELCKEIVKQVLAPALYNIDKDFVEMVKALTDGLWSFNPGIQYEAFMIYICKLCDIKDLGNNNKEALIVPDKVTFRILALLEFELNLYRSNFWKYVLNYVQYISLWLIQYFPFLAYYCFGFKDSKVRILKNEGVYD